MRRIVINMQNVLFCNAISEALRRSDNGFDTYAIESADNVIDQCRWISPYAVLMEVTGRTPWTLEERLCLTNSLRTSQPDCKVVLIVDENSEKEIAKAVKQAKKDGLIDQFVYGSISASYLADIIDSL